MTAQSSLFSRQRFYALRQRDTRAVASGQWPVASGQWSVVSSQWPVVSLLPLGDRPLVTAYQTEKCIRALSLQLTTGHWQLATDFPIRARTSRVTAVYNRPRAARRSARSRNP